ncbi:MAG: 50S ribosomal protein L35 [Clostridia bacterium]|jgi:large subunit ribosomal protein L35|nr:50S ribosomal protein L35 [Clostridia bacterium]MCL6522310.1 50S ribosomal protein L35 [Bacillota bacterium]
MPKMKTHRGAAKRFKVTAKGHLRRQRAYDHHNARTKTKKQLRRLEKPALVSRADERRLRRLLPGV